MTSKFGEFLKTIIEPCLTKPEGLQVSESTDDRGILVEVECARADMGLLIGKNGEHAKAIRTILRMYGARHEAHVSMKINEPQGQSEHGSTQSTQG